MTRLDPDSPLYNIAVAYRLHGPLDLAALEQGVRRIAGRHEMLRATFPAGDDRPIELVSPDVPPVFSVSDHRASPRPARGQDHRAGDGGGATPVRPGAGARCVGVEVLRWSDEGHVLVVAMHHIVSDAWSFYVFCRELAEFYDASRSGRPPGLPELPIQYPEFGQRQRQSLSGRLYEEQLAYCAPPGGRSPRAAAAHRSARLGLDDPSGIGPTADDPGG